MFRRTMGYFSWLLIITRHLSSLLFFLLCFSSLFIFSFKILLGCLVCVIFFTPLTIKKVSHILADQGEEVQQYVKNGSRAIRSRVFPEYVCIEDVDKIISSVQRAPEEAAGRGEPGKDWTASETDLLLSAGPRLPLGTERLAGQRQTVRLSQWTSNDNHAQCLPQITQIFYSNQTLQNDYL